ncbi:MAG: RsmB/NOP family class I SAM-dependent RNA methyltransferase [Hyphomicrobiaceae bacterium]
MSNTKPKRRRPTPANPNSPATNKRQVSPGLAARASSIDILSQVLHRGSNLEAALATANALPTLHERDRRFARLLALTVLRRFGQLQALVDSHLDRPLPKSGARANLILLSGTAQLLLLNVPAHAAINTAVALCRQDPASQRFDRLINAILRRVSEITRANFDARYSILLNFPEWMIETWREAYGHDVTDAIAAASLQEAPLDLTVKSDVQTWAKSLNARILPTKTLRRQNDGSITNLPGYKDGAWWVQDAAAALPVRLLGSVAGRSVADLCAAPGGKTAQLASAGATVVALDHSPARLERLRSNLTRLKLSAQMVTADASAWAPGQQFDAVLLDAPCSATGTIRRHPDILHRKRAKDTESLSFLQDQLLRNAARLVRPGGLLVYCTCSLEPLEGDVRINRFLSEQRLFERVPVQSGDIHEQTEFVTDSGDIRTLPAHWPDTDPRLSGLDGFFASRLRRMKT